jgi:hypothetical protein
MTGEKTFDEFINSKALMRMRHHSPKSERQDEERLTGILRIPAMVLAMLMIVPMQCSRGSGVTGEAGSLRTQPSDNL